MTPMLHESMDRYSLISIHPLLGYQWKKRLEGETCQSMDVRTSWSQRQSLLAREGKKRFFFSNGRISLSDWCYGGDFSMAETFL